MDGFLTGVDVTFLLALARGRKGLRVEEMNDVSTLEPRSASTVPLCKGCRTGLPATGPIPVHSSRGRLLPVRRSLYSRGMRAQDRNIPLTHSLTRLRASNSSRRVIKQQNSAECAQNSWVLAESLLTLAALIWNYPTPRCMPVPHRQPVSKYHLAVVNMSPSHPALQDPRHVDEV